MNIRKKTHQLIMTALFMAIIIIMILVPNVGYINLVVIKATLVHVPVIIGSIVLGPKIGAILGLTFGITSLITNTINPSLLSFAFSPFYQLGDIGGNGWSVFIAILPRVLVGIIPYYVYQGIMHVFRKKKKRTMCVALPVAAVAGSLVNTLLVMNLIYICFREEFASAKNIAVDLVYDTILVIIAFNGIPEAIVAAVATTAIGLILIRITNRNQFVR